MVELAFPERTLQGDLTSGGGCIIIGESWPAWLPTAAAVAGRLKLHVFTSLQLLAGDFKLHYGGWGEERMWMELDEALESGELVLISGSTEFVERMGKERLGKEVVVSLDGGNPPSDLLRSILGNWHRVRHSDVGGATTAYSWIGAGSVGFKPVFFDSVRRSLRDFLSSLEAGKPVQLDAWDPHAKSRRVERLSNGCLHPGGLLPWKSALKAKVMAPGIFSPTKWVERRLTAAELLNLWDLPHDETRWFDLGSDKSFLPLVLNSAPTKVLWHFVASHPSLGVHVKPLPGQIGTPAAGISVSDRQFGLVQKDEDDPEDELLVAGYLKAAKADDAAVDISLWDHFLFRGMGVEYTPTKAQKMGRLRSFLLTRWKRNLILSFGRYRAAQYGENIRGSKEGLKDLECAREAIGRASSCTWWEWTCGSSLFFWRWPPEIRRMVRDGLPSFVCGRLPSSAKSRARRVRDEEEAQLVAKKLKTVVDRGYIVPCKVVNYTDYFHVPKPGDIRMVYNGTSSGVNDALWSPKFALPSPEAATNQWSEFTMSGDSDQGEMFLNYKCDGRLRKYFGVDLSPYAAELGMSPYEARNQAWDRQFMGKTDSPYGAIRTNLFADEIVRGDRSDPNSPFRWDKVEVNLPGSPDYDPTKSWVSRYRLVDGKVYVLANDSVGFVDDDRALGNGRTPSEAEDQCWAVLTRAAKVRSYLGMQDAARKRRPPMVNAGAWAGTVFRRTPHGLGKAVTQEKWTKHKAILSELVDTLVKDKGRFDFKPLEQKVGFLNHMARTYEDQKPFLKGLVLTMNSWRPDRDSQGWKDKRLNVDYDYATPPPSVMAVPRLAADLKVLTEMSESEKSPTQIIRPTRYVIVRYGFGDASGTGFSTSISTTVGGKEGLRLRVGVWGRDLETEHSSYTEMRNWTEALEREGADGFLTGAEIFAFTDNSTLESAYFSGSSTNSTLFELVVRLYKIGFKYGAKIHLIHCSGKRQIQQGMDGASRGDLTEGVLRGDPMLAFVPLCWTAFDYSRDDLLLSWVRSWSNDRSLLPLLTDQWFDYAHGIRGGTKNLDGIWTPTIVGKGTYLWAPPPSIAREAVAELRKARHKRPTDLHIFCVPRIMGYLWRKQLEKESDVVLLVRAGRIPCWPVDNCETLLIALCLPFIRSSPWKLGRTPRLLGDERRMRRMLQDGSGDPGTILRKLCQLSGRLDRMSPSLVRQVLFYEQLPGVPNSGPGRS